MESISNNFQGPSDPWWQLSHGIISDVFPSIGDQPSGLNPLQQQLALQLIDKLKENMEGWYPALTRVLLATIGPYNRKSISIKNRTAFVLLKEAVYFELQQLPHLYKNHPKKLKDYLPDNIRYDVKKNQLIHTYFGGKKSITELSKLKIKEVDFLDKQSWNIIKP